MQEINLYAPQITDKMLTDEKLSFMAMKIYVYIYQLAFNGCTYSNEQIATKFKISARNVQKHIQLLVEHKYLKRDIENGNERTLIINIEQIKTEHSKKTRENDKQKFIAFVREFVLLKDRNHLTIPPDEKNNIFDYHIVCRDKFGNVRIAKYIKDENNKEKKKFLTSQESNKMWTYLFNKREWINKNLDKFISNQQGGSTT